MGIYPFSSKLTCTAELNFFILTQMSSGRTGHSLYWIIGVYSQMSIPSFFARVTLICETSLTTVLVNTVFSTDERSIVRAREIKKEGKNLPKVDSTQFLLNSLLNKRTTHKGKREIAYQKTNKRKYINLNAFRSRGNFKFM